GGDRLDPDVLQLHRRRPARRHRSEGPLMGQGAPSPQQLLADAAAALQRGDRANALSLLSAAEAAAPFDPHVKMQKALVHRMSGALPAALAAIDEALALDPYNFLALLSKGAVTERLSGERVA